MLNIDCDFHIHGKYSAATSSKMIFETISKQAVLKGLDVVGTGDALHALWLAEIRKLEGEEGILEKNGCRFIITTEVEDARRVHHLLFFPEISSVEEMRERLKKYSDDLDGDGRPHLRLRGEELLDLCSEYDIMAGPSHAFVPWTSIYKEYDSLQECYGKEVKKVKFLELGLSADTYLADSIKELQGITFLSNSDAHSPWPHRLGREFNRLSIKEVSYGEIKKAIERKKGRKVVLNVGLDPRLGKYHKTSCIKCYGHYKLEETIRFKWRCPNCRSIIKKGVEDRIRELSDNGKVEHPEHRPPYLRIAPLAEIITLALKKGNIYSKEVQETWNSLVSTFGSEIPILVDTPIEEIKKISDKVATFISLYRDNKFEIIEGGGGRYGRIIFDKDVSKGLMKQKGITQSNLDAF